jgi:hypothetical protein
MASPPTQGMPWPWQWKSRTEQSQFCKCPNERLPLALGFLPGLRSRVLHPASSRFDCKMFPCASLVPVKREKRCFLVACGPRKLTQIQTQMHLTGRNARQRGCQ